MLTYKVGRYPSKLSRAEVDVDVGKVDISIDSGLVKDETGGEDTIEDLEALMTMLELLAADDVELFETEMAAVVALMIGGGVVITRA